MSLMMATATTWIILGVLGFLLLLVLIILGWAISVYNSLVGLRNSVDEAYSTMDVYMKKRYDLIPNIVETVKGYAKHEKETLTKVIEARNMAINATAPEDKAKAENVLNSTLKTLFALSESYPELKANQNFLDLQNSLKTLESEIANARKYYNGTVKVYNVKREVFPSSIIAKMFNFEKRALFEITNEEERKAVKVEF